MPACAGTKDFPRHQLTGLQAALVALLVLSAILNYIDRQATAAVSPTLKVQFHLNAAQWGWINSSFSLVYIFTSFLGGAWMDRVGVRRGLLLSTIVWSLAAAGHALATGFWSFCLWRGLLAAGEGPGGTALLKGVRRLMPPRLRDTGTALVGAGSIAGAAVAPLIIIPLAVARGWQMAFLVSAAFSLLWLPCWALLAYRPEVNLGPAPAAIGAGSDHAPQRLSLRSGALWATLLAIFFTVPPTVFVQTFLPLYLTETFHLTQAQIARYVWQPFLATDLGQLTGGACAALLLRHGWKFLPARRLIMVVGFLGSTTLLALNSAPDLGSAMLRLNFSRFVFQAAYTMLLVYGIESVAEGQTALKSGLMNATFSACNFVFNPLIGGMADYYRNYQPVIVVVGLSPVLGLACWLFFSSLHARRSERAGGSFP
jgi:ACS family hexuronate transporter-like MFS transporter